MDDLEGRPHHSRKVSEVYNNTRPGSSSYGSVSTSDLLPKPHHHFMSMYNSVDPADRAQHHQATLERLEALRMASELEAFRQRHMMEFPETTITRFDYSHHHLNAHQQQQQQEQVLRRNEVETGPARYGPLAHQQHHIQHHHLVQQQQQQQQTVPMSRRTDSLQQLHNHQQQRQQPIINSNSSGSIRPYPDQSEPSFSNHSSQNGTTTRDGCVPNAVNLTQTEHHHVLDTHNTNSPAMSTPSSTDTCQNGRSETLLNNKDEAWQQMSEDSIKPEVNVLSELEDEEDEVKTLQELQSTINSMDPVMLWSMANQKILTNFSLWDILLGKLRLTLRTSSPASRNNVSLKDKFKFLLQEITNLLDEVSNLWNGCCDHVEEPDVRVKSQNSNEDIIHLSDRLSKLFQRDSNHEPSSSCYKIRQVEEMSHEYQHIFDSNNVQQSMNGSSNNTDGVNNKPVKMVVNVKVENADYFGQNNVSESDADEDEEDVTSDDVYAESSDPDVNDEEELNENPFKKENSKRNIKPSGLYPSVNVPRKGEKERKKLKEERSKHKDEKLASGNGKPSSVDLSRRKIRKDKIPGPPYVCQGCHATYSQRKTLRIHVKSGKCQGVPKTERPKHKVIKGRYFCLHPVCVPPDGELGDQVTSYTCAEQVWQHFADKHVEDQSTVVPCELCSKRFPSNALVDLHYKLSHEPKFTCKYCGQPCMSKQKLQNHERRHTGEKPFACEHCDFKTNFKNSLNTHKARIHDKNLVKKHMCELCGKSFFTKTCLREHIVTHTDAKRYSCEVCGKLLRNDSSYRRHMMCVHGVKQTCELCGKDIYTKTGLERHKKEAHGILP